MPKPQRFPEHGFMRLQRDITSQIGNYGIWITPQAAMYSESLRNNRDLYLSRPGRPNETSWLLNLALPAAQELFYAQFVQLIERYNCTRVWLDYNTNPRPNHWNSHEAADRQGLLELGFYRGLYSVLDRTLRAHPGVWIEGCASGGRLIDLGMLSRTHSVWINDDSVSDDRNRLLRSGANVFLPAHYLQNAFFMDAGIYDRGPAGGRPIGFGGDAPSAGGAAGSARLLSYFNGVLQFGQGISYWDAESLGRARVLVSLYKQTRGFLDPLRAEYYRLFDEAVLAVGESVIKRSSPPNVLKDTYDRRCY